MDTLYILENFGFLPFRRIENGVYPIGKAQRVAKMLNKAGYSVSAEEKIRRICHLLGIESGFRVIS